PALGKAANQVLVDEPYVYVVNSTDGTLQVLQRDAGAAAADAGLGLGTLTEITLGASTYPQWMAKVGSQLYVTLYGTASQVDAGQKVVQVDVSNPGAPHVT